LIGMPDVSMSVHRAPIILTAARNNVPAVYPQSFFARDGGLLSYGVDLVDTSRRAEFEPLRPQLDEQSGHSGEVAAWPIEAGGDPVRSGLVVG
jgi:hypothetical protein